jgi:[acyl-carrier-protein] S-malonyltransferase
MTLAILCSGQGHQGPEMFAITSDAPEAAVLFAQAKLLLGGRDARQLVSKSGPDIFRNRTAQVLCTLQALAASAAFGGVRPRGIVCAGYSVGEIAAWGVSGVLQPTDCLSLVARRAELMTADSSPGDGLVFIRGLPLVQMRELCGKAGCEIAIINPDNAFVVGGHRKGLEAIERDAKAAGAARIVPIPIDVASHTSMLRAASKKFREALAESIATFPPPNGYRLISGIDGNSVSQPTIGMDKLAAQISQTVMWADNLQACVESGTEAFLELGPGSALRDMAAATYPSIPARSLSDFRSMAGVRAWIAGALR